MTDKEARKFVAAALKERGYIRNFDAKKRKKLSSQVYKKGYEVRFTCDNAKGAKEVVGALKAMGITSGKPFAKGASMMVPVYGKDQCETLESLVAKKK